jgi:hypothetical protein
MGYKLLGYLVWKGGRWALRRKYGRAMMPKPLIGAIVAGGIVVVAVRSRSRTRGLIVRGRTRRRPAARVDCRP